MLKSLVVAVSGLVLAAGLPGEAPAAPRPVHLTAALSGPTRVMCMGDSITVGSGDSGSPGDGYRTMLGADMVTYIPSMGANFVGSQRSGSGPNPWNEGYSGATIDQLAARAADIMRATPADLVLLDVGINDADHGATGAVMLPRIRGLVATILASSPTVRVIVARLMLPDSDRAQAGIAVLDFNAGLPALAGEFGGRVALADMSVIKEHADALHPSHLGYRQMTWQWYQALRPWYGQGSSHWLPKPTDLPWDRMPAEFLEPLP
jgi:lysophospholipase L1-like esterase